MHADEAERFIVAVGVAAPLRVVEQTLRAACGMVSIRQVSGDRLVEDRAGGSAVVFVELRVEGQRGRASSHARGDELVRYRHTPSALLRRVVSEVTARFGAVRLWVRRQQPAATSPGRVPHREQAMTLAGFLRSGRVMQEDTLIHVVRGASRHGGRARPRSRSGPPVFVESGQGAHSVQPTSE